MVIRNLTMLRNAARRWRIGLLLAAALGYGAPAAAGEWNCQESQPDKPQLQPLLKDEFLELQFGPDEVAIPRLEKLLTADEAGTRSLAKWYLAARHFNGQRYALAEGIYREMLESDEVSTRMREDSRSTLTTLYGDQGRSDELLALYERPDRPVCDNMSAQALHFRITALSKLGWHEQALQLYLPIAQAHDPEYDYPLSSETDWDVTGIYVYCNARMATECARQVDHLARRKYRADRYTQFLNRQLPALARYPEVKEVLAALEKEGVTESGQLKSTLPAPDRPASCTPPTLTQRTAPSYPQEAKSRGISGHVRAQLHIGKDGTPKSAVILYSDPKGVFDAAAISSLLKWKFEPCLVDGQPVESSGIQSITFNLLGDSHSTQFIVQ